MRKLPAEWAPQDAVLLTWPHKNSDWAPHLNAVTNLYLALVEILLQHTNLIIVAPPAELEILRGSIKNIEQRMGEKNKAGFFANLYPIESNDTWARDHGPITVFEDQHILLLDFTFNGWGNKFAAHMDNKISSRLHNKNAFGKTKMSPVDYILEGGAIESDGAGSIMTTSACLLNTNRNVSRIIDQTHHTKKECERLLKTTLGATNILWLDHGYLKGDDTDSHIDTLARFAPNNSILYVACDAPDDEHYEELAKMEAQLRAFKNTDGDAYTLLPLPWPAPKLSDEGERLPATYANFLVTNNAVIVPTYGDTNDQLALKQIQHAFPKHKIYGIDCSVLIEQHGSLHCITMQIPKGVLSNKSNAP